MNKKVDKYFVNLLVICVLEHKYFLLYCILLTNSVLYANALTPICFYDQVFQIPASLHGELFTNILEVICRIFQKKIMSARCSYHRASFNMYKKY